MIKKWLKVCHVQQTILFNLKHVCPSFFNLFFCNLLLVPNDEDGDTVFIPIKSNDDDEPVGFEKRIKVFVTVV